MTTMKRVLFGFMLLLVLFTAAACGDDEENGDDVGNGNGNGDEQLEVDINLDEAFNNLAEGKDVFMTNIGQNEETGIIWDVLESVFGDTETRNATIERDALLEASDVPEGALVILVPGASSKGMGGAGVDQDDERVRAEGFGTRAQNGEITLVVIHSGGMTRRGTLSDPLIDAAIEHADLFMATTAGNDDEYLSDQAVLFDIPFYLYSSYPALIGPLSQIFGQ